MKKTLAFAASGALALGTILGVSVAPASADTCVSKAEYGKIKNGMTVAAVKALTGTNGTSFSSAGSGKYKVEIRSYKTCTKFGSVSLGFLGGKLNSKAGVF